VVAPHPFAPPEAGGAGDTPTFITPEAAAAAAPTVPDAASGSEPGATGEAKAGPDAETHHRHPLAGGSAAAKAMVHEVSGISAWMLASAAILVAFVVAWFAGILLSFRHQAGLTARERILEFFAPGTLAWAIAVLLALALFEVGRRSDPIPPADPTETVSDAQRRKKRFTELLPFGLFLAAAAVTVSAFVGVLVELTNFGNGIDQAFSSLISYLALVILGGAATWLAFKETGKTSA
jgi:hypothetical protein